MFADLLTRYYTDYEPEETWVAECGGQVVGYLTGCQDTRRYWRSMTWGIIPAAVVKAVWRGTFFCLQTWWILGAGLQTLLMGGFWEGVSLNDYPAHLHINISRGFRGQELGRCLMEKFTEDAKRRGLKGIHLVTRGDNLPARRFFEKFGFRELIRRPLFRLGPGDPQVQGSIIYGKKL